MESELIRRGEDLRERCERTASVTHTAFLTPAEQYELQAWAKRTADCRMIFRGGVEGAERNMAFFLPFYLEEDKLDEADYIRCVKVTAAFGQPGHRDYMGAALGLGIKREWIGDILVTENVAHILCRSSVAEHLLASLDKVGRWGVKTKEAALGEVPVPKREMKESTFSVKSLRIDAVAAGMFNLSRTSAAEAIGAGLVSLNYGECLKPDAAVAEGDIISLRGRGKGTVLEIGGKSRKDRIFVTCGVYK